MVDYVGGGTGVGLHDEVNISTPHTPSSIYSNISQEEYLRLVMGPKRLPESTLIPVTVVYILLFITGTIGNFSVCLVIAKNKSMQSATNLYLFNLAVSDLTLLILGKSSSIWGTFSPCSAGSVFGL